MLAAGELNAVLSLKDGGANNRMCDRLGNFSAINYATPISYTVINRSVWKQLSPQQQATFGEATKRIRDTSPE